MLLAKLKYAFLGLVTLAVVSTSVGVVAQTGPDRPADNDRLKAVEQKLDRLLEVLGGSRRGHRAHPTRFPSRGPGWSVVADATQPPPPAVAPLPPGSTDTCRPRPLLGAAPSPRGATHGYPAPRSFRRRTWLDESIYWNDVSTS